MMQSRKPSNSDFWRGGPPPLIQPRVPLHRDKNSAAAPLDLSPAVADLPFKADSIAVRGQFNCTMNMPSTGRTTLP